MKFPHRGSRVAALCAMVAALTMGLGITSATAAGSEVTVSQSGTSDDEKAANGDLVLDSGLSSEEERVMAEQAPLLETAEAAEVTFSSSPQWAGSALDVANRQVIVYWVGESSEELDGFVAQFEGTSSPIRVMPANSGLSALKEAANELGVRNENEQLGINVIAVEGDASGLTVRAFGLEEADDVNTISASSLLVDAIKETSDAFHVRIATGAPIGDVPEGSGSALTVGTMTSHHSGVARSH